MAGAATACAAANRAVRAATAALAPAKPSGITRNITTSAPIRRIGARKPAMHAYSNDFYWQHNAEPAATLASLDLATGAAPLDKRRLRVN
ncbi:hypothetical protein NJB18091_34600 [Mycobacterium marinum]|nr:hypothetical protein NJB18091_34600 [Mycobacterium marinum]GJO34828.1 hypothetical protein NJB1507_47880 [Mycobacterium marinum]